VVIEQAGVLRGALAGVAAAGVGFGRDGGAEENDVPLGLTFADDAFFEDPSGSRDGAGVDAEDLDLVGILLDVGVGEDANPVLAAFEDGDFVALGDGLESLSGATKSSESRMRTPTGAFLMAFASGAGRV